MTQQELEEVLESDFAESLGYQAALASFAWANKIHIDVATAQLKPPAHPLDELDYLMGQKFVGIHLAGWLQKINNAILDRSVPTKANVEVALYILARAMVASNPQNGVIYSVSAESITDRTLEVNLYYGDGKPAAQILDELREEVKTLRAMLASDDSENAAIADGVARGMAEAASSNVLPIAQLWDEVDRDTSAVKPCPCCGASGDDLSVGVQSAISYGVKCDLCGLTVERDLPDTWPVEDTEGANDYKEYALNRAIRAWNQRPQ